MLNQRPYLPLSAGRYFLAVVGLGYALLAAWCTLFLETAAGTLGYELARDSGRSEFLAVYGGGQLALGAIFLWPLLRHAETRRLLVVCVALHGSMALFRAWSLVFFRPITGTTLALGLIELAVFFAAAGIFLLSEESPLPGGTGAATGHSHSARTSS